MATYHEARAARIPWRVKKQDEALMTTPCPECGETQAELELSSCPRCWRVHDISYEVVGCCPFKAANFELKHEARHNAKATHQVKKIPSADEEGIRISNNRDWDEFISLKIVKYREEAQRRKHY